MGLLLIFGGWVLVDAALRKILPKRKLRMSRRSHLFMERANIHFLNEEQLNELIIHDEEQFEELLETWKRERERARERAS